MRYEGLTGEVIGAGIYVHRLTGPGLVESVYDVCLAHELTKRGLQIRRQVWVPLVYDTLTIDKAYRLDLIVEEKLIVEVKSIKAFDPVHTAQLLTYMRLMKCPVGLLMNFNVPTLPQGIRRVIL
jgi:GxxExxY protein